MKASELIDKLLPNTDIDIDFHNSTDEDEDVVVELPDETYRNVKEIFWIAGRTVIRLEETEAKIK